MDKELVMMNRQMDTIPGPLELQQYQKRFLELYQKVYAKAVEYIKSSI
jgi:hypothetical protein